MFFNLLPVVIVILLVLIFHYRNILRKSVNLFLGTRSLYCSPYSHLHIQPRYSCTVVNILQSVLTLTHTTQIFMYCSLYTAVRTHTYTYNLDIHVLQFIYCSLYIHLHIQPRYSCTVVNILQSVLTLTHTTQIFMYCSLYTAVCTYNLDIECPQDL